uniref:Mitochondrial import inner membrane translocase subunit TIM17 n=1 Tax=Strongyloides papillosus TaxID=174720 RepID=A0A0N5C817_STREA
MEEYTREPCPFRIGEDTGSGFTMGLIGGSIFHAISGFRKATDRQKFKSAYNNVRKKASLTGVQFAAWGGVFSTCDCTIAAIRKQEDSINPILSGGLTGALLACRSGPVVMVSSAFLGAAILGMIEGAGLIMSRYVGKMYDPTIAQPQAEELL